MRHARLVISTCLVLLVTVGALIVVFPRADGLRGLGAILLFYLLLMLTTIPHELGHAIAAVLVGFRIARLQFGMGPILWSRTVLGVPVAIGSVPTGGLTVFGSTRPSGLRWRLALITLAGPAANLGCVWLTLAIPSEATAGSSIFNAVGLQFLWIAANLFVAAMNLWPRKFVGEQYQSDGLRLWNLAKAGLRPEEVALLQIIEPVLRASSFHSKSQHTNALRSAREAHKREPAHPLALIVLSETLIASGEIDEGLAAARAALNVAGDRGRADPYAPYARANIAIALLLLDDASGWPQAREIAEAAYVGMPWDPVIANVYGSSIAVSGDVEEGLAIIDRNGVASKAQRAFREAVVALAALRCGRIDDAVAAIGRAKALGAREIVFRTADRLLRQRQPTLAA